MLALELKHLVGRADRIFVGKVVKTAARWRGNRIVTDATLRVERDVNGTKVGETVVVTRLGGTVNGIGMRVSGVAMLRRGERVLLFTEMRRGTRYVVGMSQGVYRAAQIDGRTLLTHSARDLALVKRSPSGLTPQASPLPQRIDLDRFVSSIKATLATCRANAATCTVRRGAILRRAQQAN